MKGATGIFILLILLVTPVNSSAQTATGFNPVSSSRHIINTLNYEHGLINNFAQSIVTDKNGFTWVSTQTGLQRYNGYRFVNLKTEVIGSRPIIINYPVPLFKLNNGSILIFYRKGILRYDFDSDAFSLVNSDTAVGNSNIAYYPLYENDNKLFCLSEKDNLVYFELPSYKKKSIRVPEELQFASALFKTHFNNSQQVYSNYVQASYAQPFIYFAVQNKIIRINTTSDRAELVMQLQQNVFNCLSSSKTIICAASDALLLINRSNGQIIKQVSYQLFTKEPVSQASLCILNDSAYSFSINGHLFETNQDLSKFVEIKGLNNEKTADVGFINQIYYDSQKRLWALTNNNIRRIQYKPLPFKHFYYREEKNNFIKSIFVDTTTEMIVAGCYNSGLQLYDLNGTAMLSQSITGAQFRDIVCIGKIDAEEFLAITLFNGWFVFNASSKSYHPLLIPDAIENKLKSREVNFDNNIIAGPAGDLLVITNNNIFSCTFKSHSLITADPVFKFDIAHNDLLHCFTTYNNRYYIGTRNGKFIIADSARIIKSIDLEGNFYVRSICMDKSGMVWIGCDKGLFIYTPDGQLIKKLTTEHGLRNDCIYALLPSQEHSGAYASTNLGLSYIDASYNIINYPRELGLQENEFNTGSAFISGNSYYFGGINGITCFVHDDLKFQNDKPGIFITRFLCNDSLIESSTGLKMFREISLSHYMNHIQFDIVAMGLFNPTEYVYQYRLTGFENKWQVTNNPVSLRYTLQPGHYTLEVKCSTVQDMEHAVSNSFNIIIRKPWYNTLWFYAICILAISGFLYALFRFRLKQLLKIQEIRNRLSRDLHDDIGSTLGSISIFAKAANTKLNKNDLEGTRNVIENIGTVSREMMDTLADMVWTINPNNDNLFQLTGRMKNFATSVLSTAGTTVIFNDDSSAANIRLSIEQRKNIFLIFKEAIHNISKYARCKQVIIDLAMDGSELCMRISDNGIGFDEPFVTENNTNFESGGNGLRNMKERARIINATLNIHSIIGNGTSIELRIKL